MDPGLYRIRRPVILASAKRLSQTESSCSLLLPLARLLEQAVPLPGSSDDSNCQQREWCCFSPEPPSIHCCRAELRFRMAGKEPVTPLGAETTVAVLEPAPFQHNSLIMHRSKSNSTKLKNPNSTKLKSRVNLNKTDTIPKLLILK